jgi:hypothetical protein
MDQRFLQLFWRTGQCCRWCSGRCVIGDLGSPHYRNGWLITSIVMGVYWGKHGDITNIPMMVIQPPLYKSDLNGFVTGKKRNHQQPLDLGHVECLWLGGKNLCWLGLLERTNMVWMLGSWISTHPMDSVGRFSSPESDPSWTCVNDLVWITLWLFKIAMV